MPEARKDKVARIKRAIRNDPNTACHVLRAIYDRQTDFEKFTGVHDTVSDGWGFQPVGNETREMNDLHDELERVGFRWQALRADVLVKIQRRTAKYADQFLRHLDDLTERKQRDKGRPEHHPQV